MTDPRPENCTLRLRDEGQPRPANGCRGCDQQILMQPHNDYCTQHPHPDVPKTVYGAPIDPTTEPVPAPMHSTAPRNMAEFEVNHGAPRRHTRDGN